MNKERTDATPHAADARGEGGGLVLTRNRGQAVRIGANIEVRVVEIHRNSVRLQFIAPRDIPVVRDDARKETP